LVWASYSTSDYEKIYTTCSKQNSVMRNVYHRRYHLYANKRKEKTNIILYLLRLHPPENADFAAGKWLTTSSKCKGFPPHASYRNNKKISACGIQFRMHIWYNTPQILLTCSSQLLIYVIYMHIIIFLLCFMLKYIMSWNHTKLAICTSIKQTVINHRIRNVIYKLLFWTQPITLV